LDDTLQEAIGLQGLSSPVQESMASTKQVQQCNKLNDALSYITKSLKETVVLMISVFGGNLGFVDDLRFGGELKIGNIGLGRDVQEATKNAIN